MADLLRVLGRAEPNVALAAYRATAALDTL